MGVGGSRTGTLLIRLASKHLYPLTHLSGPSVYFCYCFPALLWPRIFAYRLCQSWTSCVAQVDLELVIPLSQPPEAWNQMTCVTMYSEWFPEDFVRSIHFFELIVTDGVVATSFWIMKLIYIEKILWFIFSNRDK